jgi:hypothetical protein
MDSGKGFALFLLPIFRIMICGAIPIDLGHDSINFSPRRVYSQFAAFRAEMSFLLRGSPVLVIPEYLAHFLHLSFK